MASEKAPLLTLEGTISITRLLCIFITVQKDPGHGSALLIAVSGHMVLCHCHHHHSNDVKGPSP